MNKKCMQENGNYYNDDDEEEGSKNGAKKRGRGGSTAMEGSRCSRVNGRGWRCCQKTLVGYSLCEHHLGKGRLRSMSSVRNRSSMAKKASLESIQQPPLSFSQVEDQKISSGSSLDNIVSFSLHGDDEEEKKPLMAGVKKRQKLGMVKARSISSLLGGEEEDDNNNSAIQVPENNELK